MEGERSKYREDPRRRINFTLGLHGEILVRVVHKYRMFEKELQSSQVKRTPKMPLTNLLFESWVRWQCRFQIHLYILACVMTREFTRDSVTKFLPAQFPWIWCKCRLRILSDQIKTSSRKLFTAHYACSNSDLNLTPVTGTTTDSFFK